MSDIKSENNTDIITVANPSTSSSSNTSEIISTTTTIINKPKALLLGMVFSTEQSPKRGQMFRDRIRCESLEHLGYSVYTLDNKHEITTAQIGKHCRTNFAQSRRMLKDINSIWGYNNQFNVIILDYFFCPEGYVQKRWTEPFFIHTLPALVTCNILDINGTLWLPHMRYIDEMLDKYGNYLSQYYIWELEDVPDMNPLYHATSNAYDILITCPDNITNNTQLPHLLPKPFYIFHPIYSETTTTTNNNSSNSNSSNSGNSKTNSSSNNNVTKGKRKRGSKTSSDN
jgi:hypothetical protein